MGCLLWIQHLTDILPEFLQSFIQYLTVLDCILTALDYIYIYNIYIYIIYIITDDNVIFCAVVSGENIDLVSTNDSGKLKIIVPTFSSPTLFSKDSRILQFLIVLLYPPQWSCGSILVSLHPSVHPSVHPFCILCPLLPILWILWTKFKAMDNVPHTISRSVGQVHGGRFDFCSRSGVA